jgi:hypothetical protein
MLDEVEVLCGIFMSSDMMNKTMVPNVPWIELIGVNACRATVMKLFFFMMTRMNDVHQITWENEIFMWSMFSWKLIFRKYANSENFTNSEITPEDFANSETGAKIFSFSKNCHFVSRALVAIGGCFYNLLGNQHSL